MRVSKFLNTIPVRTIIGGLCQLIAPILIYRGEFLAAQIVAVVGCMLPGSDVAKFTSSFQFILWMTGAAIIGQSIEFGPEGPLRGSGNFPLMSVALLLCAQSVLNRLFFWNSFLHNRYLWVDIIMFSAGVAGYVYANIFYHYGWQGWVFPIPPLAMCTHLIIGFNKESKAYMELNKGGYRAKVGNPAPDFSLPDQNGNAIKLSDFKGKNHVLLLFVRGDWCPACHMMIRTYETGRKKFQEKNVFLLAVGPDTAQVNKNMAERIGVNYLILSDEKQETTKMYGVHVDKDPVARKTSVSDGGLPLPASFLICDKGIVRYHSSPERVGEFLTPTLIFDELAKI